MAKDPDTCLSTLSDKLEGMQTYIDGKMKRYSLLFAVNGGAFAVARLLGDPDTERIVGGLRMTHLAIGAVAFTILLTIDIYTFGSMMRKEFFGGELIFQKGGKAILVLLATLIIVGWLLAALGPAPASTLARS
jgi:hypothetical protein